MWAGLFSSVPAYPADIELHWDYDPAVTNIMGFNVYFGLNSIRDTGKFARTEYLAFSAPHSEISDSWAGMATWIYVVRGLPPGKWYFVVDAEDVNGIHSDYSNEVTAEIVGPQLLTITSQSVAGNWYNLSCMVTTSIKASAIFRYQKIGLGAGWSTIIATPTPTKTQHRAIIYQPEKGFYNYQWTVTSADGTVSVSQGTFQST